MQRKLQLEALPLGVRTVFRSLLHVVLPQGSQVSPASTRRLPQPGQSVSALGEQPEGHSLSPD
jgi:hypothetical protein